MPSSTLLLIRKCESASIKMTARFGSASRIRASELRANTCHLFLSVFTAPRDQATEKRTVVGLVYQLLSRLPAPKADPLSARALLARDPRLRCSCPPHNLSYSVLPVHLKGN